MEDELVELKINHEMQEDDKSIKDNNTQLLLTAVLNNQSNDIDSIIQTSTKDILSHKFVEYGNKPIVIIACINENVNKNTLNSLCNSIRSHYYNIDCFDEDWYKWEPLHYVARIADPEKLQVLLNNSVEVNSLTALSENALHVLLDYQECVKPFDVLLYNGTESRKCTIINEEKENTISCANKLIQAGIDVNHSNFWNETAICIAARYRYTQIIDILLQKATIDLDNYKEGGYTIRAYLKENYIRQDTLPQSNAFYENPVKILFDYLKSGDEEAFIQFNNENIKDYANCVDGDNEHNSSGNMLQFCFKKGFLEYLQHELYEEELADCCISDNLMLTVFSTKGLGRCIEHLLRNGADCRRTSRKFTQPLLEAAATVGYYPLVAILLEHKACNVTSNEIYEILPKLYENQHSLQNHEQYRKYVLSLLLDKLLSLKENNMLSGKKSNILHDVLRKLNLNCDDDDREDSENICRILKLGASLTKRVGKEEMIIDSIHRDILESHFNDCIENNIFCYNSIIEDNNNKYSETRVLHYLANSSEKCNLLRHPLLVHFIHNKWLRNFYFFYIDLFLYFIYLLSIYSYMVLSHKGSYNLFVAVTFHTLLIVHLIKESIQLLFLYRRKYFSDSSNYLELTVIASSFVSIFYFNVYSAVIAILFSTVIFVILLGHVPACAKYTIIFGSTKYFLQYAVFYFAQFVSFAVVFYMIFPFESQKKTIAESNSTDVHRASNFTDVYHDSNLTNTMGDVFKSLFYTLILFTGEFNERVLEPDMFPVFGRIIMAVFIFCMTIILNNLLVGLIVADMEEMQKAGKLHKQVKVANFVSRMNSIVKRLHEFKRNKFIKWIINRLHVFKKGTNKILDVNECMHTTVFDSENLEHLKSIRNKKTLSYHMYLLRSVYVLIEEKRTEYQRRQKAGKA